MEDLKTLPDERLPFGEGLRASPMKKATLKMEEKWQIRLEHTPLEGNCSKILRRWSKTSKTNAVRS